jgi:hypothetical protein
MSEELISRNVAELVKLPKARKKPRRRNSWTCRRGRKFLESLSVVLTDLDVHPLWELRRTRMDLRDTRPDDEGPAAALDVRDPGVCRGRRAGFVGTGLHAAGLELLPVWVIRRFRLPEPSRQVGRRDSRGRQRWIDVLFDGWKVAVEIDGAQHVTPLEQ